MIPVNVQAPIGDKPPTAALYYGINVIQGLLQLPDKCIQTVCTSPPYWGLRDYQTEGVIWGAAEGCDHEWGDDIPHKGGRQVQGATGVIQNRSAIGARADVRAASLGQFCQKCGAWVGQLGLEPTPHLFVEHLVEVFQHVRRVLRDDGTVWLNLGDSYNTTPSGKTVGGFQGERLKQDAAADAAHPRANKPHCGSLKHKDMVGIPWRVALALQDDGWYLRSDIIWAKNAVMPESVRDRPTKAHEYVFLLAKSERYFFDQEAVRVPHKTADDRRNREDYDVHRGRPMPMPDGDVQHIGTVGPSTWPTGGRNIRTVWTVNPQPYPGAHFACWPPALVEPMIKAGTSQAGMCKTCGAPWKRIVTRQIPTDAGRSDDAQYSGSQDVVLGRAHDAHRRLGQQYQDQLDQAPRVSTWEPSCECGDPETMPCLVMDIFSGSATTGAVALGLGRDYIGIDLSEEYLELAKARLQGKRAPDNKGEAPDTGLLDLLG